jgi:hypothetical protein
MTEGTNIINRNPNDMDHVEITFIHVYIVRSVQRASAFDRAYL